MVRLQWSVSRSWIFGVTLIAGGCYTGVDDLGADTDATDSATVDDDGNPSSPSSGSNSNGSSPTSPTTNDPSTTTNASDPSDPTNPSDPSDTADTDTTDPSDPTNPSDPTDPTDPSGSSSTTDPTNGSDPTDPTNGSGGDPDDPVLPSAPAGCPNFAQGTMTFPVGGGTRQAEVWMNPAAVGDGPLVFWYHGSNGTPTTAENALDPDFFDAVIDAGGILVGSYADPSVGTLSWHLVVSQNEADLDFMDAVVGCAAEGPGIDASRIHVVGYSAGALNASQTLIRRSEYIASAVVYSGGLNGMSTPDIDAPIPSVIMYHGGGSDSAGGLNFQQATLSLHDYLEDRGGHTVLCNHGNGHSLPQNRDVNWNFLVDHPYGVTPEPYAGGFPGWVPGFCQ